MDDLPRLSIGDRFELRMAVELGADCCARSAHLDVAGTAEFDRALEIAADQRDRSHADVRYGVALFRGHPDVADWADEGDLLDALGEAAADVPGGAPLNVLIALSARIYRLRDEHGQPGPRRKCPWHAHAIDGASRTAPAGLLPAFGEALRRQLTAAPGREWIGSANAAGKSVQSLQDVGYAMTRRRVRIPGEHRQSSTSNS